MAGELSPDRLFYWDGRQWVSAISSDGAWHWDGTAWRPAQTSRSRAKRPASRLPWLIAAGVIATIVVVSVAAYLAWGAVSRLSQQFVVATCGSNLAQPGVALSRGDSLCGRTLGDERLLADCTLTSGTPAGIDVWQKRDAGSDWVRSSVTNGPTGCDLSAPPNQEFSFDASDDMPASAVAIVDFTMPRRVGVIGMQIACNDTGCIDVSIYGEGLYRLDEGRPDGGWDNLTRGYAAFGTPVRTGLANRMILRLAGRNVSVFLNGSSLTSATTRRDQGPGDEDFYLDNRGGTVVESVTLQRMYVFEVS